MAKKAVPPWFSPELLDEIRSRLPVSQVVGKKVALKKAGREWKGLSPFRAERTPSFFVNDAKGFYHCFATGSHGDIFRFVMDTEGLTLPQAVTRLAKDAGITLPERTSPPADTHPVWQPDYVRLFISHRDTHKALAHDVAKWLAPYGVSSFVAHDTIEPDKEWQLEIENALHSMEVMLALVTDDFHESAWTNQEIGFAIGRKIPVISLKVGSTAPRGFIQHRQAVKLNIPRVDTAIREIIKLVAARVGDADKLRDALMTGVANAPSFAEAQARFDRLSAVDGYKERHVVSLLSGFAENSQLHDCFYLTKGDRLLDFLHACSGKRYRLEQRRIVERQ